MHFDEPGQMRHNVESWRAFTTVPHIPTAVRNRVGIAGKPHTATVVACIGPQTAKTAEEHGLRVDVMAPEPSIEALAGALAEFGAARRLAMIEAGEPVTRPSQRRRTPAKRKAT